MEENMNKRHEQSKTNTASTPGLKVQSSLKAGFNPQPDPPGRSEKNHSQTLARGLKVKTNVKAGGLTTNHNQTLLREAKQGLRVKTNLKAGHKATLTVRKAGAKELEY